ncbi:response regulator [Oscillibacter sp.]|uniref:response regulator n=1 Tax=Oscillibacter sp. TaxID=1945593 RepID=UPI0028975949|nr:response regulator [Oscillibacter sp.]
MNHENFRILIVDDEEKDRSVVHILLRRQYGDLFEILEAKDAAEAKVIMETRQVDLLVVDIHMPGVSGLKLVRDIRARDFKGYIMILTAFNYFEYAKEAIVYQANDFILKPPIRKEFYEAVQRFLDWARDEKSARQMGQKAQSVFLQELGDCIMLNADRKKIDAYKALLNIRENRVFCILIDTSASEQLKTASFQDEIESAMNESGIPYAVSHMRDRTAIFCFTGGDTLGYNELSVTVELKMKLNLDLCEKADITVGDTVSVYDNPSRSYRCAVAHLNRLKSAGSYEEPVEDKVVAHIRNGEAEEAIRMFGQYLLHYGERHAIDDLMLKDIEVLTVVRKSVQVRKEDIGLKMVDIFVTGDIQDIIHFSSAYLREIMEKMSSSAPQKKHYVVRQICARLEEHAELPWSINDLAKEFGFNPFYLSRLFKDDTGLCFTDYLTGKRMVKAAALITDTNLSIGEIGLTVGYNDQNYFSRVFKKCNKMGPKEYRRSQVSKQER